MIADRDVFLGDAGSPVPMLQDDQPFAVNVRQRPEQHCLDDGEDGDVGAYADCERQQGGCREGAVAPEQTDRMSKGVEQHGTLDGTVR